MQSTDQPRQEKIDNTAGWRKFLSWLLPYADISWTIVGLLAAGIALICTICYGVTLWSGFAFNDHNNYRALLNVTDETSYWLKLFLQASLIPLSSPWTTATFALDGKSFGLQPAWYHFVNICLHIVVCLYLFLFLLRTGMYFKEEGRLKTDPKILAFTCCALLACHPLATGAVAYISGRSATLAASSYLLGLITFLIGFTSASVTAAAVTYIAAVLVMLLALICSPQAMSLPFACVLIAILLKPKELSLKDWLKFKEERGYEMALFLIVGLALPLTILTGTPAILDSGFGLAPLTQVSYWASECKVFLTYFLYHFFYPVHLTVDPANAIASSFSDGLALAGLAVWVALALAMWFARRDPIMLFGFFLMLAGFVPAAAIVQLEVVSDQRFYLSLIGACIVLGSLLSRLERRSLLAYLCVMSVLVMTLGGLTIWRAREWRSDWRLWRTAVKRNPQSTRAMAMEAFALFRLGKGEEWIKVAQEAIKRDPEAAGVCYEMLGIHEFQRKNFQQAYDYYQKGLEIAKKNFFGAMAVARYQALLAEAADKLGKDEEAVKLADAAYPYQRKDPRIALILGKDLQRKKRYFEAYQKLSEAFALDKSNPDILEPLSLAALDSQVPKLRKTGYALAKKAKILMKTYSSNLLLARAAIQLGRYREAIDSLNELMLRQPARPAEAMYLFGIAYERLGKKPLADDYMKKALELNPKIKEEVRVYVPKSQEDVGEVPEPEGALPTAPLPVPGKSGP